SLDQPVGRDDAERVFPAVKAAYLGDEGLVQIDADPPEQPACQVGVELKVFGTFRVDGRRDNLDALDGKIARDKAVEREHCRIVVSQVGLQEAPDLTVRLRRVDVAAPDPPGGAFAVQMKQRQWLRIM